MIRGKTALMLLLAVTYLAFIVWYGGRGEPMTPQEIEQQLATIAERAKNEPSPDGSLREELRTLAASDDGHEFYMLNLIRYRAQAVYPEGYHYDDDPLAAEARYTAAIIPYLLRHGGVPVFLGAVQGRFLDEAGDTQWHRVAIVRYRSRRDLLEMVSELAGHDVAVHKWASIEKTHVFPVHAQVTLIFARGLVAAVLGLIGLAVHFTLRRQQWYQGGAS